VLCSRNATVVQHNLWTYTKSKLTNYMEYIHISWVTSSLTAGKEISSAVPTRIHNSPPKDYPEPAESKPHPQISFLEVLVSSSHESLRLWSSSFPSGFQTRTLHAFATSPIRHTYPEILVAFIPFLCYWPQRTCTTENSDVSSSEMYVSFSRRLGRA
jgi:hypothetical protein